MLSLVLMILLRGMSCPIPNEDMRFYSILASVLIARIVSGLR